MPGPAFSSPAVLLAGFLAASALLLLCLNHMSRQGLEGTVLGTLITPYCSGAPNLLFVLTIARLGGTGDEVVVNAVVNNVTNLTLLIGLPALFWGLEIMPRARVPKRALRGLRLTRLSLALTALAMLAFTGITWALGLDGVLSFGDGLTLVSLFLFWQAVQVFSVLRTNVETGRRLRAMLVADVVLMALGTVVMFTCVDGLVRWLAQVDNGFISYRNVGWLSGWLTVLPNAVPAFYYAARGQADIVYSSQIGDGHICIPLCVGLIALVRPVDTPAIFALGMALTVGLGVLHLGLIAVLGRVPRAIGVLLALGYAAFVICGLGQGT